MVFAGFAGLGTDWALPPLVQDGLTDEEIELIAWNEVAAIWSLITVPPRMRRDFAETLTRTAPPAVLRKLKLPASRDPMRSLKALRLAPRDRADPIDETIFAHAKARFEARRSGPPNRK